MNATKKRLLGISLAVLLALLAGGGWWAWQRSRPARWTPPPDWLTPLPTYPAYFSPTPASPTPSPTATVMPTPTATPPPSPTPTPTPALPPVSLAAEGNLHCRQGPAPFYPDVTILRPGDRAQVIGFTTFGPEGERYWFVALPDTRLCWVHDSARYLQLMGEAEALPAYPTAEPPEMAFTVAFAGQAECGSKHGWMFEITNYGTRPIESVRITFAQGLNSGVWTTYLDWWRDCATRSGVPAVQPNHSALLTVENVGPGYGQTFTAQVRACARDHFREPCAEQVISFRP